jgi:hypothetical protein
MRGPGREADSGPIVLAAHSPSISRRLVRHHLPGRGLRGVLRAHRVSPLAADSEIAMCCLAQYIP